MADDQILDPLGIGSLDIASMVQPPPTQQPQLPTHQKSGKGGIAVQAALAAIVPLIAKRGGPLAVAGLLRGFQQAQAERQHTADLQGQQTFENQRQLSGDQRAQDAQQATEQYRQQTLAGSLWKEATSAIQNAESPDAIGPLLALYKQRMAQLGMRDTGALDRFAQQTVTPSRMEQKAAQKYIGQLEKTYGQDWAQKVGSATFVLPGAPADPATGKPKAITVQELLAKSGLNMNGLPVKPPTERQPIPGSFEDFTTSTDPAVRERILADRKLYGQSDDKGTDPTLQAIRDLTLEQKQAAARSADNLSPRQQQQVSAQARGYDSNQVVKNTQIVSEGANFAQSMDPNTKNPADDQALIYAFAKAMDPNSVVREGEYATVQHYAQSWAESFGFNASRVFANGPFLTPEARANMKRTILQKFKAAQAQYKAVRASYVVKINKITGLNDGEDWLTDYGAAFPTDPNQPQPTSTRAIVTPPSAPPARAGGAGPAAGPVPNPFRR